MIFWSCVCVVLIFLTILFACLEAKQKWDFTWRLLCAILAGTFALSLIIGIPLTQIEYNEFEHQFEIQRNIYESFDEDGIKNNIVVVTDIVDVNGTLARYQAKREIYGIFSRIPERVLDIEPIGINGG